MIIEMFLLKGEKTELGSVTVTLTPETIGEEKSLRNAKVLHKNRIMVYWGDTLELGRPTGCKQSKQRTNEYLGFSGLKINFGLPKPDKPLKANKSRICQECGVTLVKLKGDSDTLCKSCQM